MPAKKSCKSGWRPWGDHPWYVVISTLAAVATIVGVILALSQRSEPSPTPQSAPPNSAAAIQSGPDATARRAEPRLPEDAARVRISVELSAGRIGAAIQLLNELEVGPVKNEECEHVFSFCIKNPLVDNALERATTLAN